MNYNDLNDAINAGDLDGYLQAIPNLLKNRQRTIDKARANAAAKAASIGDSVVIRSIRPKVFSGYSGKIVAITGGRFEVELNVSDYAINDQMRRYMIRGTKRIALPAGTFDLL